MGQEARSQGLATFTTSPNSGVIPAKGTLDVVVTLQASRLGRIQLPLQIKVCVMLLQMLTCDAISVVQLGYAIISSVSQPHQHAWAVFGISCSKLGLVTLILAYGRLRARGS